MPDIGPMQKIKDNAGCGRDGMVDIPDLKSVGRMPVWVRIPPPAPNYIENSLKFRSLAIS